MCFSSICWISPKKRCYRRGVCEMGKRMCCLLTGVAMYLGIFILSSKTVLVNRESRPGHSVNSALTNRTSSLPSSRYHRSIFSSLPSLFLQPFGAGGTGLAGLSGPPSLSDRRRGLQHQQRAAHSGPRHLGLYVVGGGIAQKRHHLPPGGAAAITKFRHPLHPHQTPSMTWCKKLSYRQPSEANVVTALASFPGSGNTWLRYLIQQATGFLTGSVYQDQTLRINGFPGEGVRDGSVVVVKTHETQRGNFDRAILLVRDPYKAILAEFNRQSGGHVGHARPKAFKSKGWPTMVQNGALSWERFNTNWAKYFESDPENLLVVHYSQLRNNTEAEVKKVLEFLEISVTNSTMQCVMKHREGRYHRQKKQKQDLEEVFDSNMTSHIETIKARVYHQFPKFNPEVS